MRNTILFLLCFLLASINTVNATSYVNNINYEVSGSQMDGMLVSVEFNDQLGDVTDIVWNDLLAPYSGGVSGNGWSLTFTGDDTWYYLYYWELYSSRPVKKVTINAFAGGVLFDIFENFKELGVPTGFPDTPGSYCGWWEPNGFEHTDSSGTSTISEQVVGWEFRDDIALWSAWPNEGEGDLYGTLVLTFEEPATFEEQPFRFQLDTDHAIVPEPDTSSLLGLALLVGVGATRRHTNGH